MSYITQRIFIFLIFHGFHKDSKDEEDDQEKPNDLELEQDGCGLGDGAGGEQNITD
jgi:hypothetical protein